MKIKHRIAATAGAFGLAAVAALAGAADASANTYTYSSIVKCVYPNGAYTWVQWGLDNTGSSRRAFIIAYNQDIKTTTHINGGQPIQSISVAELNGGGTYGTGYVSGTGGPYYDGIVSTSTTQMPYVGNSTPVTIHWHLHQYSTSQECLYNHAM